MSQSKTAIRLSFGKLLTFLLCFAVSLGIFLLTMQAVAPEEIRTYASIPVTVEGGIAETVSVTAAFAATKTEHYRYETKGISAKVILTENRPGEYLLPVSFYVEGEEIQPVSPVRADVTVIG